MKLILLAIILFIVSACGKCPDYNGAQDLINQCVYQCKQAGYNLDYIILFPDNQNDSCYCK